MPPKESFEKSLEQLESIVEKLEDSELPLDQSLKLFEDGIKQARFCEKKLSEAEGKIEKLIKAGNLSQREKLEL